MQQVDRHIRLVAGVRISNVWLFSDALDRRVLVDTGHPIERMALRRALKRAGIERRGDLSAIVLTHRHSDHAGNSAWLRGHFDCPIVCHEADAAYLTGARRAPRLATPSTPAWARPLCRLEDAYPSRVEIDEVFADGPWRWGFEVSQAAGHTEGSVLMHHGPTRTLFSGDVILAGVATIRFVERVAFADPAFSEDIEQCRSAVREFLQRLPRTDFLCAGHGPPVVRDAHEKLLTLLKR